MGAAQPGQWISARCQRRFRRSPVRISFAPSYSRWTSDEMAAGMIDERWIKWITPHPVVRTYFEAAACRYTWPSETWNEFSGAENYDRTLFGFRRHLIDLRLTVTCGPWCTLHRIIAFRSFGVNFTRGILLYLQVSAFFARVCFFLQK